MALGAQTNKNSAGKRIYSSGRAVAYGLIATKAFVIVASPFEHTQTIG